MWNLLGGQVSLQLLTLEAALDYPGSLGAVYVEVASDQTMTPKHLLLRAPGKDARYCFTSLRSGKVSPPLLYEEVGPYARYVKHIPNVSAWLALVG